MKTVLLIDDDEDEFEIFSDAIKSFPNPVRCIYAESADQCFHILQNMRPDIIFVDMNMPRMNGIECIKNIKAMHKQEVPLIVLYSTHIDDDMAIKAIDAGAVLCIQKTYSIPTLVERLHPILEKSC